MARKLKTATYQTLLQGISRIYGQARQDANHAVNTILIKAYWQIGRRIVLVEQNNELRAQYGSQLLERLSKDLTARHGKGFSVRNLLNMRQFYQSYKKIPQAPAELSWTHYQLLSSVEDPKMRRAYEQKALSGHWSCRELSDRLKQDDVLTVSQGDILPDLALDKNVRPLGNSQSKLPAKRGRLNTCRVKIFPQITLPARHLLIDFGFGALRTVASSIAAAKNNQVVEIIPSAQGIRATASTRTPKDLYFYKAYVERVIDGDTLLVMIDLGPGVWIRERVRLNGIDAPELSAKPGVKAKKALEDILRNIPFVILKTSQVDMYHRYLADVFYRPGEADPNVVGAKGMFLNQELLDAGVVRRMG